MGKQSVRRPVKGHYRTINGRRVWVERHTSTKYMGSYKRLNLPIIRTYRKPLASNRINDFPEPVSRKIVKSIRDNASIISAQITDVLEYGYAFSTGDIFTLIKNKGIDKGISLATSKICEQIDNSNIYGDLKEEYDLSDAEIVTIRRIIKEIVQKVIEYIADKIIDYIDSKSAQQWAEEKIKEHIKDNLKNYFSHTYGFMESNEIRDYFRPSVFISVPAEIKIKAKKEIQIKNAKESPIVYGLHPFICYYADIDTIGMVMEEGVLPEKLGNSEIEGIKICVLEAELSTGVA